LASPTFHWRTTLPLCQSVGGIHVRGLGPSDCETRSYLGIQNQAPQPFPSLPYSSSARETSAVEEGDPTFNRYRGYRACSCRARKVGGVFCSVPSSQGLRGLESHPKSQICQQIPSIPKVQNAVPQDYSGLCAEERCDDIAGPPGSLPARANPPGPSPIPEVCLCRSTLPISDHAVRPFLRTSNFYKVVGGGGCDYPAGSDQNSLLSRRYFAAFSVSSTGSAGSGDGDQHHHTTRLLHKPSKEPSSAYNQNCAPGGADRFGGGTGLPVAGTPNRHQDLSSTCPRSSTGNISNLIKVAREIYFLYLNSAVGAKARTPTPVVPPASAEVGPGHICIQGEASSQSTSVPQVVGLRGDQQGLFLPGTQQDCGDIRREPVGLGRPPGVRGCPGSVVSLRSQEQHKLARASSCPPCLETLPGHASSPACPGSDGQYDHQGPYQSRGGHPIPLANDRDRYVDDLGRDSCSFPEGGTHFRVRQRPGRLAQPEAIRPLRVETPPGPVPVHRRQVRPSDPRPLCQPGEYSASSVHLKISMSRGSRSRRPPLSVAPGSTICLSASSPHPEGNKEADSCRGGGPPVSPALAKTTLVRRPGGPVGVAPLDNTSGPDLSQPGGSSTSRPRLAALNRVAFERVLLRRRNVPGRVIGTIQAARRPSTTRIYESSWRTFCSWCRLHHVDPTSASVPDILVFLQDGFDKGLAPSTLKRQVAALSTVLSKEATIPLTLDPSIKGFLKGASNIRPTMIHRYPTWDLTLVLQALTSPPFEPLGSASLKLLSFKVTFLLAITSARRVSELAALSIRQDLCIFKPNTVVLRLDPAFLPKINSSFHRSQEIILPDFCPSPRHRLEDQWHTLDVRRALRRYIARTSLFRKSEALLVSFHPSSLGQKISSRTVACWIKACIALAYSSKDRPVPGNVWAHSTRSAATSAAWSTQASVVDICRAATWTSLTPFVRHYKIDTFASAEASFGRRVLQRVVSASSEGTSQLPTP
ncbi:uncharacterized protein LOC132711180, partial [Pantherophis guttatus]|uniref:Uncharacterized protein LOC132711180 n=1 Tax=Pantherophis guttatus TaxID=94885 RepID=A0ABM3ZAY6_PANGU